MNKAELLCHLEASLKSAYDTILKLVELECSVQEIKKEIRCIRIVECTADKKVALLLSDGTEEW